MGKWHLVGGYLPGFIEARELLEREMGMNPNLKLDLRNHTVPLL